MKRKIMILSMLLIGATVILNSCKKGEDDPFITLHSRKARLTGEWKLTEMSLAITNRQDNGSSTVSGTMSYDGTNITSVSGGGTPDVYPYSYVLTINKDGSYESALISDVEMSTTEGGWYWISKSKKLELKGKEAFCLVGLHYVTNIIFTENYAGKTDVYPDDVFVIQQLKNKEMVILIDENYSDSDGYLYTSSGTMTFEKE